MKSMNRRKQRLSLTAVVQPATPPAALLRVAVQHVLYAHQQIPCVYRQMVRDAAAPLRQPHSRVQRKAAKLVGAAEQLFGELPAAFSALVGADHAVAAIVLGPSVASPRLAYLLRLDAVATAPTAGDGSRRLLAALALHSGELAAVDPGLCRMHLLLAAPADAALPAGHFRARPGLQLKLQRAHVATVVAGAAAADATDADEQCARATVACLAHVNVNACVWRAACGMCIWHVACGVVCM